MANLFSGIYNRVFARKNAGAELPVTKPRSEAGSGLPAKRQINASPLDDWFLALPDKLPPKQISAIMRQAAAGNLWNQHQLSRRMEESWPMYKKCIMELKLSVASVKYTVHPYTTPGAKPSKSAQEKADVVRRAITTGFKPDRFADEDGIHGMVFDLCEAIPNGISIVELLWDDKAQDPDGGRESMVRASCWVHPRNIGFTRDGRMGVMQGAESGNISFNNQITGEMLDDPNSFLVAKLKSKSGSPLTAGLMRSLADIWSLVVYGRDYARLNMQKYGNPFLDIAYDSGITDQSEIDKFEQLAAMAAANLFTVIEFPSL